MENKNELALVSPEDLSLVDSNSLNANQLSMILKRTPQQYVKKRPAKGGGTWDYVTGGYVKKCLNIMFGWDWDFEIIEQMVMHKEAIVKGRLTCRTNGKTIIKTQFGNKDVVYRKGTDEPLSIGNDLKAACTDCLKKCAAELGIAADIYNKEDFREVKVDTTEPNWSDLNELYLIKKDTLTPDDQINCERIIKGKEKNSFAKLTKKLKAI